MEDEQNRDHFRDREDEEEDKKNREKENLELRNLIDVMRKKAKENHQNNKNIFFDNVSPEEMDDPITIERKKNTKEKAESLSKDAHAEIYFFLEKNNIKSTCNQNGYFFNINNIDKKVFIRLEKLINFCYDNEKKLEERFKEHMTIHDRKESDYGEHSDSSEENI
jgi:hypothetical protein